jgi:hypothetical protein
MFQFAILLLQVAKQVFSMLEARRLIGEGERRQILREMEGIAAATKIAKEVRQHVESKTDAEVDDALRGDYRD